MNQKPPLPLVRLSLIQPMVQELDRRRLNTAGVLAANGLVRQTVLDPNVFVPPIVIHRFLEAAAQAANDPYLCARVGESLDWASWPPLVDAVSRAGTLGEFLIRFICAVKDEATSAHHALEVGPSFAFFRERRNSEQEIVPAQNDAFTAAYVLNLLRRGAGESWSPEQVLLTVADPGALPEKYLGVHVFTGDRMGMTVRFPSAWLLEPFNRQAFARSSSGNQGRIDVPTAFLEALRHALLPHLSTANLGVDFVAQLIGTSRQSLQRKLRAVGTTLSAEISELKKRRAIDELENSDRPITGIAASLGFSDPTSFTRAFRSWTGVSPREYRKNQANHH